MLNVAAHKWPLAREDSDAASQKEDSVKIAHVPMQQRKNYQITLTKLLMTVEFIPKVPDGPTPLNGAQVSSLF